MNFRSIVKAAASFATSTGVGMVVGNLINTTTPEDLKRTQKVMTLIGAFAVTGLVSNKASEYMELQVDSMFDTVDEIKKLRGGEVEND